MDQQSGLLRHVVVTAAKTSDSEVADALITGDERAVYGDKGYQQKERRQRLRDAGIKYRIAYRRHKTEPTLNPHQAKLNKLIARIRAPVENIFSQIKRRFGRSRMRCYTLARNACDNLAALSVLNLQRAALLTQA